MEENPYKSPRAAGPKRPANNRELAPLWQRLLALPIIMFGVFLIIAVAAAFNVPDITDPTRHFLFDITIARIFAAVVILPFGVGLTWIGLWLHRK